MNPGFSVALDVGGTFTDVVGAGPHGLRRLKTLSDPERPDVVLRRALEFSSSPLMSLAIGSTVATNLLLEKKGARIAFITTKGFKDILEIARQTRPDIYALRVPPRELVVERNFCFELDERIGADGEILRSPGKKELAALAARVTASGAEAVAVALLFAYLNPVHEIACGEALRDIGIPVALSHAVSPRRKEYERALSACITASLIPGCGKAFFRMQAIAEQFALKRTRIMTSDGGLASIDTAAANPITTLLSGPAGGVIAAQQLARRLGRRSVISFDMGGTSTDVALCNPLCDVSQQTEIAELSLQVPSARIHTIGAGGGSIARILPDGTLSVGPESAGADPGPACYGKGESATVTDANLFLERLPVNLLGGGGGELPLDMARAAEVLQRLADELGIGISACAEGILRIVESNMAQAIRRITMERGIDPRRSALIAFGGAGPLHGAKVAELLGISEVLIPESPGLFSALGVLTAAPSVTLSAPIYQLARELRPKELNRTVSGLVCEARTRYRSENEAEPARVTLSAELRYVGQPEGLMVRCRGVSWQPSVLAHFEKAHRSLYGFNPPAAGIELMSVSVGCAGRPRALPKAEMAKSLSTRADGGSGIVERISLEVGRHQRGPLVITQYDSTTYVPPGWTVSLLEDGTLLLAKPMESAQPNRESHRPY